MKNLKKYLPHIFLLLYTIECVVLAIDPYDRAVWFAENIPVIFPVLLLILTFKKFRFSNLSYFLMTFFFMYHTYGGHYTFELAPFELGNRWLSQLNMDFLFPDGRNNFDRLGHFLVGILGFPIAELFLRKGWVKTKGIAILFGIVVMGFWGALYEVIEMYYAVMEGGDSGAAFLGSQGDIWDAQKDMFLDILGACAVFLCCGFWLRKRRLDAY